MNSFSVADQTTGGEPILQYLTQSFFAEAAANLADAQLAQRMLPSMTAAQGRIISIDVCSSGSARCSPVGCSSCSATSTRRSGCSKTLTSTIVHSTPTRVRFVSLARADLAVLRNDRPAVEQAIDDAGLVGPAVGAAMAHRSLARRQSRVVLTPSGALVRSKSTVQRFLNTWQP
ncbi:MAG: hypothetical protein R2710_02355 [Acidimicrobiales bacterium]